MTAMPTGTARDPDRVRVILAINFNHDGAGAVLVDGRLRGFVCTERFSRKKKHPGLREPDLADLLGQAGIGLAEIDHVLLCNLHNMDSPDVARLHGTDLKETWFEFWVNQRNDTVRIGGVELPCTVNPDHHTLHAACAYYTSPFDSAICVAIDPLGCRAFAGRGGRLYPLNRGYDAWFTANIGYCTAAEELFDSTLVGAGKVMGLAPYGRPGRMPDLDPTQVYDFAALAELAAASPHYVRANGRDLNATLAYYIQLGLERQVDAVLADLGPVAERNGIGPNLCLSGGTALNAVANQLCFERSMFQALHLHPACGDDGTAIGAALWYWHHVLRHPRQEHPPADLMYSVRTYSARQVADALAGSDRLAVVAAEDHPRATARLIAAGAVVGWFDGAGEIGPRALGHRSILADPRDPGMADRLNRRVKHREPFRPFAPSVLNEHASEWFGLRDSPYMLRACPVLKPGVPAVTHVDGTSRIQTVDRADNSVYHQLIAEFHALTGVPLVLNTSLNARGEPIVETPADAVRTLLATELDYLVFPGLIVGKADAPGAEPAEAAAGLRRGGG